MLKQPLIYAHVFDFFRIGLRLDVVGQLAEAESRSKIMTHQTQRRYRPQR
jgi:hypothetical protein